MQNSMGAGDVKQWLEVFALAKQMFFKTMSNNLLALGFLLLSATEVFTARGHLVGATETCYHQQQSH